MQYIWILVKHFDTVSYMLRINSGWPDVSATSWTEKRLKDRKQRPMTNSKTLSWEEVSCERCKDGFG